MDDIGTLSPVEIRQLWSDEAKDFTPWLAENADLLGKALRMDLTHVRSEAAIGRYSADPRTVRRPADWRSPAGLQSGRIVLRRR